MNTKASITGAAAAAAAAAAFFGHRTRVHRAREAQFECRLLQEAVETFEGEGGLVLS